jgi:shikimate dehydrogenase
LVNENLMSAIYGLIGKKLGHSFSKDYFTDKFKSLNIDATYNNYELESIGEVKELIKTKGLIGLNVTIPYKEAIIPFLDEIDEVSKKIGAVNTIVFKNGKAIGYNTDAFGFQQMIKPFFKSHHERSIILGTGGASKAIAYVLERLGCTPIFISRYPKAENQFAYEEINKNMIEACPLIVNTTPVGMFPNETKEIDFPVKYLSEKNLVIDLIYNPKETIFLQKAKTKGAWTLNGLTMLHQQAEKSWEIWNS